LFEPLQLPLQLQLADLLERLSHLDLNGAIVLVLLASGELLTGAIEKLLPPLAHLDRVDGVISG
jgi:hypothetical protein